MHLHVARRRADLGGRRGLRRWVPWPFECAPFAVQCFKVGGAALGSHCVGGVEPLAPDLLLICTGAGPAAAWVHGCSPHAALVCRHG